MTLVALLTTVPLWAQQSFLQRDLDANGRLSPAEACLSQEEFQRLDESGSGELSWGEFEDHWNRVTSDPDLENAAYGPNPRQTLDLYLPSVLDEQVPLFIWIHGGSWKEGDKEACPFQTLTQHGVAVASIHYRFTDEARYPAQLDDCQAAIDFLREEAKRRGLKFGPITACGLSAGGHLSLMLAGRGSVDNVIAFAAPVDLTPKEAREGYRDTLELLVGTPLEEYLDELKAVSPVYNLGTARYILIHGTEDRLVPYQQAIQMTMALARAQVNVELMLVPRGSHTVVGGPIVWNRIVTLLEK